MRILVMSDIHANYTALEAVLKDAGQVDDTWCLGDRYGPDRTPMDEIRGNMLTCLGQPRRGRDRKNAVRPFNGDARRSLVWHERVLSASNADFAVAAGILKCAAM
jgi:predicted phosphodiesterase